MSWYSDTTEKFRKKQLTPEHMARTVHADYGHRRIEVAEAYWRIVTGQAFAITNMFGLDWSTIVRNISQMSGADESLLLPSLLRDYVYEPMFGNEIQFLTKHAQQMRMESLQTSIMWAWGYGKGVYDIDPTIAESVMESPLDEVSDDVLKHMPYRSVFIPYRINDCIGAFFHRAEVPKTGQVGLSFLLLKQGWPNIPDDKPDFTAGMIDLQLGERSIEKLIDVGTAQVTDPDTFRKYMNLLLLLCCRNIDIVGRTTSTPGPSIDHGTRKSLLTTTPRHWDVGKRQGAALQAALAAAGNGSAVVSERSGPRPHVRRAHWHSYLTGPRDGERSRILHWVAPILVGAGDETVETHHRVQ